MFDHQPRQNLDSTCDAPPYAIVQACRRIGVRKPEDVRWCRLHQGRHGWTPEFFRLRFWTKWLTNARSGIARCSCGKDVPEPVRCTFTFNTGREVDYLIGQCRRCQTVFWDEP
jgi:hypothetical protein